MRAEAAWSRVSTSVAIYHSAFFFFKKSKHFCNNKIYTFLRERGKAHFLQNCKLKIIRLMGEIGVRQAVQNMPFCNQSANKSNNDLNKNASRV